MATAVGPDGVVLAVALLSADGSPSQERLLRIAAMLRDAERAAPVAPRRPDRGGPHPRVRRPPRRRRAA